MSRIRVLDIAKELGLETKTAIVKLQDFGVVVKNHFSTISDAEADKLRSAVKTGKSAEKDAGKPASKMVIRRRSPEMGEIPPAGVDASSSVMERSEKPASVADKPVNAVAAVRVQPSALEPKSMSTSSERATSQQPSSSPVERVEIPSPAAEPIEVAKPFHSEVILESPASAAQPQASAAQPQASAAQPQASAAQPQASAAQPQASAAQPQASAAQPQASAAQPQATAAQPQATAAQPQATAAQPQASATGRSQGPTQAQASAQQLQTPAQAPKQTFSGAVIVRKAPVPTPQPAATYSAQGKPQVQTTLVSGSPGSRTYMRPADGNRQYTARPPGAGGAPQGQQGQQGQQTPGGRPAQGQRDDQRGGFTRPEGGRPFSPRPGFGPRPEGDQSGDRGNRFGSAGGGARFGGGAGAGAAGGRPTSFVTSDVLPTKEGGIRPRADRDRDRDRRGTEEEESRRHGKVKGRHDEFQDELLSEDFELPNSEGSEDGAAVGVRTVYAPIPNRKRGSGASAAARKREMRRAETANPTKASKKIVRVDASITVNDLAGELSVKVGAVIKTLMQFGMMASVNQALDFETATVVAQEFGFETQNTTVSIGDILSKKSGDTSAEPEVERAPVVTVMGHVDHGKTSLLDAIRKAEVAAGEAGGITQHIGAYQVTCNGQKITFLDTPGHEAFTAMRARGAQITDIVILVVAADDGVMPQTIEAINHAKSANVPIIVAINKVDKPGINIDRVQRELSQHGVTSEEWGGEHMFVQVSAKTKQGVDNLLESILLQSEVLELKARIAVPSSGVVVEAKLDKARGPVATVLITQGTLRVSDWIVAGTSYGRVRAMFSDRGEKLLEADPATPVEILGLDRVPAAGDQFNVVANDDVAKEAVAYRFEKARMGALAAEKKASVEDLMARMAQADSTTKELPLIIKGDTQGSVEAIKASVLKLNTDKVKTKIIHSAVGGVTETDVVFAKAAGALIIGFNVRPDRMAASIAEQDGIEIRCFSIIYELIDSVRLAMAGRLDPIRTEKVLGRAEIRSLFSVPKIGVIAGSFITDGKVIRNAHVRVVRDGTVVYTGRISSLKRFKDDAKEVLQGFECGLGVENYNDLKVSDVLEAFVIEETAATLN